MSHTRIAIIHDGIHNSVFEGQVIQPLRRYAQKNPTHNVIIISFEKKIVDTPQLATIIPSHFTILQLTKTSFMGLTSLAWCIYRLKKVLAQLHDYSIIARGPIAGYLATQAQTPACKKITIQARGLLAQEYGYTHQHNQNKLSTLWHRLRQYVYHRLEKKVYAMPTSNVTIEAVSPALQEYLITTYGTPKNIITVAVDDIPEQISQEQKKVWREKIRHQLSIDEHAYVYCYNGSAKSWQCPEEVLQFFMAEVRNNPQALLLIVTQEANIFLELIKKHGLKAHYYRLVHVCHEQIFWYLAAADAGLLFREPHIINWISRPTKALEYKAARLEIIHNSTVAYVITTPRHTFHD